MKSKSFHNFGRNRFLEFLATLRGTGGVKNTLLTKQQFLLSVSEKCNFTLGLLLQLK